MAFALCAVRCSQDLNSATHGHLRERFSIFAIAIPDQKARRLAERRRLVQLLNYPGVGRRTCHSEMDNSP